MESLQIRKRKLGLGLGFVDGGEFVKKSAGMIVNYEENREDEEKVLFVEIYFKNGGMRWFTINPRGHGDGTTLVFGESSTTTTGIHEIEKMRAPGEFHDQIACYSTAVVGSLIYFIGGVSLPLMRPYKPVDDVSIYDTNDGTWYEGPSLNVSRAYLVAVVVVGTTIYVFGTAPHSFLDNDIVDIGNWVECYDSNKSSGRWRTISGPKDVVDPYAFVSESTFAVVNFHNKVLFVGKDGYYYVFDTDSDTWEEKFKFDGPRIHSLNFFNLNHVVIGDFAFWHWYGELHAWDLTTNETFLVGILEDRKGLLRRSSDLPAFLDPHHSQLVHLGNGFMCIAYWIVTSRKRYVFCYTFKLEGYPFSSTVDDSSCNVSIGPATACSFVIPGASFCRGVFGLSDTSSGFPLLQT